MVAAAVAAGAAVAVAMGAVAEYAVPSPVRGRMGRPTAAAEEEEEEMLRAEAEAGKVAEDVSWGISTWNHCGTEYAQPCIASECAQGLQSSQTTDPGSTCWPRTSKRAAHTAAEDSDCMRRRTRRIRRRLFLCAPGGSYSACPTCTTNRICSPRNNF